MTQKTAVTQALDARDIDYKLHVHDTPLRSLKQAAEERGLTHQQIVRSLLFRLEDHSYVMVLVAGPGQVSWSQLRRYLGVRRLTTAEDNEVLEVTGYPPGAVSPVGLKQPVRILADERIKDQEVISIGAGMHNAGVILKAKDLLCIVEMEFVDFAKGS
jgi:Cys-tRNA(Pro) deacylase